MYAKKEGGIKGRKERKVDYRQVHDYMEGGRERPEKERWKTDKEGGTD